MFIFDKQTINDRQTRAAQALGVDGEIILVYAGAPIQKPGGHDQVYGFIPHPHYYWLTGSRRWGGVLAFEQNEGWIHFVRPVTDAERLWEGGAEGVEGEDVGKLDQWLGKYKGRECVFLGQVPVGREGNFERSQVFANRLDVERRRLDTMEIALVEKAVFATAAGHKKAREIIGAGITERQVQIELEAEMMRYGADEMGYGTIVGTGSNAAVLHFDPSDRVVAHDDLVLIDAGGSVQGYTADVTRTYPSGDVFTPRQQVIYDIVLQAELDAIAHCKAGTEWHDVHCVAARVMAQGLCDEGILKGEVDTLLEIGAIALFFPHGVGHMLGLGVRGVGGQAPNRTGEELYCGARVRVDLPLEAGFLMTVEPGIYFVPAILDNAEKRHVFKDCVDWHALEDWRAVGGIRIEDNVLITNALPRVLTHEVPK